MTYQESKSTKLSNGRVVNLDFSCSVINLELMNFTVYIKDGTKLEDNELEECNNAVRHWAENIVETL